MPIPVISSFSLKGKYPIDERLLFETIQDMKDYSQSFLPDIYFSFVKEDQNMYIYSSDNSEDPDTGKWRKFEGGSGSSERYIHNQTDPNTEWKVQHGLNEQYPSNILCINNDGDEVFGDVNYFSTNLLIITFVEPLNGKCIVVK